MRDGDGPLCETQEGFVNFMARQIIDSKDNIQYSSRDY